MSDIVPQSLAFDTSILAGNVIASSLAMYTRDLEAYLAFAGSKEMALKPSTLARWRVHLVNTTRMSPKTINRMLTAVRSYMAAAAEQEYISHELADSFRGIRGVKEAALKNRMRIRNRVRIEPNMMRRMIDSIDTSTLVGMRNKALFMTAATSGLRIKELATLKLEQVSQRGEGYLLHMYAEQGKNQQEDREANIAPEAVQAIDAWLKARPVQSPYIFTSFGGRSQIEGKRALTKHISSQGAWLVVKTIAEPFIPGVKPHDFRRFVGTQVGKKDLLKAQKALGHKRIETTRGYILDEIEVGTTDNLF